jgi:hypothetical protein
MKVLSVVAFVLFGVGLILTPLISDHIREAAYFRFLEKAQSKEVSKAVRLGPGMAEEYRWFCWITGGIMLLIGAMLAEQQNRWLRTEARRSGSESKGA